MAAYDPNCAPPPDMKAVGGGFYPTEDLVLIKRLAGNELNIGERAEWRIDEVVPERDGAGRYAHVTGVMADLSFHVDIVAANLPAIYPGHELYGVLSSVQFEALGGSLMFLPGNFDGRRLRFDTIMREGAPWVPDPTDIPDADATDLVRSLFWIYRFGTRGRAGRCRNRDGAIPLAWLRSRNRREDTFRAVLGIPGSTALPGIGTGTAGLTFTRVDLYAYIAYFERPVFDAAFRLREFTDPATERYIEPVYADRSTRCEHAEIRHMREDTGALDHVDYTAINRRAGASLIGQPNMSAVELARSQVGLRVDPTVQPLVPADIATTTAPGYVPILTPEMAAKRSNLGRLPAYVSFARGTHTTTRYQVRERFGLSKEEARAGSCALGLSPTGYDPTPTRDIPSKLLPTEVANPVPKSPNG